MSWIKDRGQAFNAAVGVRRYVLGGVFSLVVAGYDAINAGLKTHFGLDKTLGVPSPYVGAFVALALVTWFLLEALVEARELLRPKLRVWFDQKKNGMVETPVIDTVQAGNRTVKIESRATYLRIHVESSAVEVIRDCFAYLIGIEKRTATSTEFSPVGLTASLPLVEGNYPLPPSVPRNIDFLICNNGSNNLTLAVPAPYTLRDAFKEPATYRFEIVVIAEKTVKKLKVEVDWNGQWDGISAREVPLI